jgi:hypothetical protein
MNRTVRDFAIAIIAVAAMALLVLHARSEPQTRFYDARGNSLGTSTTTPGGGTTFYSPLGNVTGKTSGPCPASSLACGPRRWLFSNWHGARRSCWPFSPLVRGCCHEGRANPHPRAHVATMRDLILNVENMRGDLMQMQDGMERIKRQLKLIENFLRNEE